MVGHCSCVGSQPVGLWPEACRRITYAQNGENQFTPMRSPPEVARTVVAQPPIAAKWFGRVFRSCVRLCGGSCVVRVTCVLLTQSPQAAHSSG